MKRDTERRPVIEVCSDCEGVSRRHFLRSVGHAAAAVGAASALPVGGLLAAAPEKKPAETYVKTLYDSLSKEQRKVMCFSWDHEKRSYVNNNWHIVDKTVGAVGKLYTSDQKELIRLIFKGVTSEDGYERFMKQMGDDDGGFDNYTCAIFGKPGTDQFEWVLTGRHLTIRADGNTIENTAFGGPIFYGHAVTFNEKPDHPGNVWWHQARLANSVYKALDGKQQKKALNDTAPADKPSTIRFKGSKGDFAGVRVAELSADQKELVEDTMKSMLSMYRKSDVEEVMACLKKNGGLDALHMSFYKQGDLGNDGIWDRWLLEGPAFAWYFRGSPHVHTWVNVGHHAPSDKKRV